MITVLFYIYECENCCHNFCRSQLLQKDAVSHANALVGSHLKTTIVNYFR